MPKITPKDFFLQIGIIITLYVSAVSLIALLFQVINIAFPDALEFSYYSYSYDPYSAGIRSAIASLIIIFPIFLFLSWLSQRDLLKFPEKRSLGIRRWLVYLTLFAAGAAIATDLVVLVNSFLGGEITTRFILKVLVVLVTTGLIFGYYVWDLRRQWDMKTSIPMFFRGLAILIVIASLVTGFVIMGSPLTQRDFRLDEQKIYDLQSVQWQIINFWQQKEKLPGQLSELQDPISGFIIPVDAETGQSYEYRPLGANSFELCATFNQKSPKNYYQGDSSIPVDTSYTIEGMSRQQGNWYHDEGRVCFNRTIDPDLYRPSPR